MVRISMTLAKDVSHMTTYIEDVKYFLLKEPDGLNFYIDIIQSYNRKHISSLV